MDTVGDLELQPFREVVEYKDQEKINDSFHTFARNYQLVYIGPNTATHQIGSSVPEDIGRYLLSIASSRTPGFMSPLSMYIPEDYRNWLIKK